MGVQATKPKSSQVPDQSRKKPAGGVNVATKPSGNKSSLPKALVDGRKKPKSIVKEDSKAPKKKPSVHSTKKPRPRTSTLLGQVTVLGKDQRPGRGLWWFAGGRTRGSRGVPTGRELRDRKKVERANRQAVGFLGTILGVRAVKRVPKKPKKKVEVEKGKKKVEEAANTKKRFEAEKADKKGSAAEKAKKGWEAEKGKVKEGPKKGDGRREERKSPAESKNRKEEHKHKETPSNKRSSSKDVKSTNGAKKHKQ